MGNGLLYLPDSAGGIRAFSFVKRRSCPRYRVYCRA